MKRSTHSFVWGGLAATLLTIIGANVAVKSSNYTILTVFTVIGIMSFTLLSCLILKNNFVGGMILDILDWGFVQMPGLIFTLDLDGIIWLLTVKLLFWLLNIFLALLCAFFAITLGLFVSVFVYPFAIYKSYKSKINPQTTVD